MSSVENVEEFAKCETDVQIPHMSMDFIESAFACQRELLQEQYVQEKIEAYGNNFIVKQNTKLKEMSITNANRVNELENNLESIKDECKDYEANTKELSKISFLLANNAMRNNAIIPPNVTERIHALFHWHQNAAMKHSSKDTPTPPEPVKSNNVRLKRGRNELDSPVRQDSFTRQISFMCTAFNDQKKLLELKHRREIEVLESNNGAESVKGMLRRLKKENNAFKNEQVEATAHIDTMEMEMKFHTEKLNTMKSSLDDLVESVRITSGV